MHGAGAAEGEQRKAARVFAALQRVHACGVGHVLIGNLMDAPGGFCQWHTEPDGNPVVQRTLRGLDIEDDAPAQKIRRVQVAQDKVRVGHGWLAAAACVAGRSRVGAGRVRADFEQAERVHARDRATTRADLNHFDDRQFNRKA